MTDKNRLLRLLRDLMVVIENSSEDELAELKRLSISGIISDIRVKPKGRQPSPERRHKIANSEAERLLVRLASADSREEARSVLEKRGLSRASLEFLARELDLPVVREDNSERLIQKIVEGAIGTRLNALAIRGT